LGIETCLSEIEGLGQVGSYDVADRVLGAFGEKLTEYAMTKYEEEGWGEFEDGNAY
jgi:hypothetical protein